MASRHGEANEPTAASSGSRKRRGNGEFFLSQRVLAGNIKREHTSGGARKIRERLSRRFSGIKTPAKSTIHAVLDRRGLVERCGRLRRRAQGTALSLGKTPNWFMNPLLLTMLPVIVVVVVV
jgi:hypothetical protein